MGDATQAYWEEKYASGHSQSYPWDMVVSFIMRSPRLLGKTRSEIRILELGCGTGANLWCAAREGFDVAGIDISASAIDAARARFVNEGLHGDFATGGFTPLPFEADSFELVIDRASTTCVSLPEMQAAVEDAHRVLVSGGFMFLQGYGDTHSSAHSGSASCGRTRTNITEGTLAGQAQITFLAQTDIEGLFGAGWHVTQIQHVVIEDQLAGNHSRHVEWRVIARKS